MAGADADEREHLVCFVSSLTCRLCIEADHFKQSAIDFMNGLGDSKGNNYVLLEDLEEGPRETKERYYNDHSTYNKSFLEKQMPIFFFSDIFIKK